jgi:hypothetical protein
MNKPTTAKAQAFIAMNPALICRLHCVDLYEDPRLGDEATLMAITADGRLKVTEFWECPDFDEALCLLDL